MTAPWAEAVAQNLEQSRRDLANLVPQVPADAWAKPSEYGGWSYKDQLAHLPESHRGVQGVLRAIMAGEDPDFSRFLKIDEINEENRVAHLDTAPEDLLISFNSASETTESMVRELTAEHEAADLGPMTLGQALQGFNMHDRAHTDELRKALQA